MLKMTQYYKIFNIIMYVQCYFELGLIIYFNDIIMVLFTT